MDRYQPVTGLKARNWNAFCLLYCKCLERGIIATIS